jgi:hypothetical protein
MSVLGLLLTLVGALAVLALGDGPNLPRGRSGTSPSPPAAVADATSATTVSGTPATARPPGAPGAGSQGGAPTAPAVPTGPPATPEQVAALLAGLPLQLAREAPSSGGQPPEVPPEEVDKTVDDVLRQLGVKP